MEGPVGAGQVEATRIDNRKSKTEGAAEKTDIQGLEKKGTGLKAHKNGSAKEKGDPADAAGPGKEACSAKTRKRTKTGCLSKPQRPEMLKEVRLTCYSMPQTSH